MKSAGNSILALIPPTLAAAIITASGFLLFKNFFTKF